MFGPSVSNALIVSPLGSGFTLQLPEQRKAEAKLSTRQLSAASAGVSSLPLGLLAHPTFAPSGSAQTWHSLHALNRAQIRENCGEEVIPSALSVGHVAERHTVGESDLVESLAVGSQHREGDTPQWRNPQREPNTDTTAELNEIDAARKIALSASVEFDPHPNDDWDFDFSGDGRPFRFARGKVSRARGSCKDGLRVARAQLRGEQPMQLADRDADGLIRHVGPTSPFGGLGECGDPFCGAHRIFNPQVRTQFRDYVVDWARRAVDANLGNCRDNGLRYTSIGSGELFFDAELIERIRSLGVWISQVCLIDREYRQPGMRVKRALREFADWQRASAHLDKQRPAEIFVFGHIEDCMRVTRGSHLIVHCDAHWENFFYDCEQLALQTLEPEGLLARLNPQSLLREVPQSGSQQQEAKLYHSKAVFSVAAWTLISGKIGKPAHLQELHDSSLEACMAAISAANSAPLADDVRSARDLAQKRSKAKAQAKAKAQDLEKQKQDMRKRAAQFHEQTVSDSQTQAHVLKEKMAELITDKHHIRFDSSINTRDETVKARVERQDGASLKDSSCKLDLVRRGFTVWRVIYDPQVAVRALPRISANRVGVLFKGEEVLCSNETKHNGWIQIAEGPARAKLPSEAWICYDSGAGGYGIMLEEVQVLGSTTAAAA